MRKIEILVVDDHPIMREALQMAVAAEPDMKIIGEAGSAKQAFELLSRLKPDVILMDLLLPDVGGLEIIQAILLDNPAARIMVLSSMEDEERILAAVQAGALGYYPKTAPRAYLLEGIRKVADGLPYMPAGITLKLFSGLRKIKTLPDGEGPEKITARQKEILALLAEGKTDEEIGKALHLSESTVRAHVHHILQRLGLKNRSQAVAYVHKK